MDAWPAGWARAVLDSVVLATLAHEPSHGYAVARALEGHGFGRVRGGALYPMLGRLEEEGLLTSSWTEGEGGPGRRSYAVSDLGRRHLVRVAREWDEFADETRRLLQGRGGRSAPEEEGTDGR